MTREEIVRMAREAGIPIEFDWAGRPSTLVIKDGGTYLRGIQDLERFAALIAAHEREECALICDDVGSRDSNCHAWDAAAAIRARG